MLFRSCGSDGSPGSCGSYGSPGSSGSCNSYGSSSSYSSCECVSGATWSNLETILLNEVCTTLQDEPNKDIIAKVYSDIVDYSTSSYCFTTLPDIVLRKKTVREITSKINFMPVKCEQCPNLSPQTISPTTTSISRYVTIPC